MKKKHDSTYSLVLTLTVKPMSFQKRGSEAGDLLTLKCRKSDTARNFKEFRILAGGCTVPLPAIFGKKIGRLNRQPSSSQVCISTGPDRDTEVIPVTDVSLISISHCCDDLVDRQR